MTKTQARYISIAVISAVAVATVGTVIWMVNSGRDMVTQLPDVVTSPESVSASFVAAYQVGDTPTMCRLSTGEALSRMQGPGWCDTPQGWATRVAQSDRCTTPDGRKVYTYKVNPLVLGQRGMEIAVADTGQGVWRVVLFGHTADRTLCDIYR